MNTIYFMGNTKSLWDNIEFLQSSHGRPQWEWNTPTLPMLIPRQLQTTVHKILINSECGHPYPPTTQIKTATWNNAKTERTQLRSHSQNTTQLISTQIINTTMTHTTPPPTHPPRSRNTVQWSLVINAIYLTTHVPNRPTMEPWKRSTQRGK